MNSKELEQLVMDYYRNAINQDFDAIENGRPLQQSPYIIDAINDYLNSGLDVDEDTETKLINLKDMVEGK